MQCPARKGRVSQESEMSGLICQIDLPDDWAVELDSNKGVGTVWRGEKQVFHGLYDNMPEEVLGHLCRLGILRRAHDD